MPCEKILIVDDNEADRVLLKEVLTENGVARVDSVASGEEAMQYVSKLKPETQPELIFLDLTMQGMSGLDLLRWLRQNSVFHHIPVVILTNSRNEEDQATAVALRAKAFYIKPMQYEELHDIVKKALQHCEPPSALVGSTPSR